MTENKRFRTSEGIFEELYPSESIIDTETGKVYYKGYAHYASSKEICDLLNKLVNENDELKQFKEKVLMLLDEKIRYYMKQPCLAVRIPVDCEYRHSCLHNNSVNVCNKAKENACRELEKELEKWMNRIITK